MNGQQFPGQQQPQPNIPSQPKFGLDEKLKKFKTLTMVLLALVIILVIVLGFNLVKMRSVETCYADGYNRCVELCNDKIDSCNIMCGSVESPIMIQPPGLMPETPIEDNATIQMIT